MQAVASLCVFLLEWDNLPRLADTMHLPQHVCGAWGLAIPEGQEQLPCLDHLPIAYGASGLTVALPVGQIFYARKTLRPRPVLGQLIDSTRATMEETIVGGERTTQDLIDQVGSLTDSTSRYDDLHRYFAHAWVDGSLSRSSGAQH